MSRDTMDIMIVKNKKIVGDLQYISFYSFFLF